MVERESNFAEEQEKERECVREREGLQEEAGHKEGRNSVAVALVRLRAQANTGMRACSLAGSHIRRDARACLRAHTHTGAVPHFFLSSRPRAIVRACVRERAVLCLLHALLQACRCGRERECTHARTHARTREQTIETNEHPRAHTHTNTQMHTCTHARTHARNDVHTQACVRVPVCACVPGL